MEDKLITILISSITGVITFFVGQKRAKREIEGLALHNVEKSLTIYQTIIEDLKIQVEELLVKVGELETKVDELKTENHELKDMLRKKQDANTFTKK